MPDDTLNTTDRWDGIDRRSQDVTLYRLGSVESGLKDHIERCEKQTKRVFYGIVATFGWLVTHSPEVRDMAMHVLTKLSP